MSRRDDRDRPGTRRRRDRSPSSPPRKARRRDQDDTLVPDGMDWNNLMTWQRNPLRMSQSNCLQNPSSSQLYQHPPVNYMMPFPPEPASAKTVKTMMPPPGNAQGHPSQPAAAPGYPATLPVQPQKAWLTPPEEWQPENQLYSFTLPMTVANTPHNTQRDMLGMDIRTFTHGGISNWLLRPFAHGRFVPWEGFRTRTEALLWSTCSKLLRRSQPLNLLTLEKDLANSLGLNIDDFNQRIKVHEHLGNLVRLSCPILRKMRRCRSTTTSNVRTSFSRRSTRRHRDRRLLLR